MRISKLGANINLPDALGRTPLMFAIMMGRPEIVRFLLAHGADISIDQTNGYGVTAMSEANRLGNEEIIQLLSAAQETEGESSGSNT